MPKPKQLDPRNLLPSNADPDGRKLRKELEKNSSVGYTEPIILGLIGVGLLWNMENQVQKYEERKEKREKQNREREDRHREDRRRTRSTRRPPPSSRSQDYDGYHGRDDEGADGYYDKDDRRYELDRYYQPRGYDRDHYYYAYHDGDDRRRGRSSRYALDRFDEHTSRDAARSSMSQRRQFWVDGPDGQPRYERRVEPSSGQESVVDDPRGPDDERRC